MPGRIVIGILFSHEYFKLYIGKKYVKYVSEVKCGRCLVPDCPVTCATPQPISQLWLAALRGRFSLTSGLV